MAKIAVLGAGESGVGAAILAKQKGFDVWVSDKGQIKEKYKDVILHHDIPFEEGEHTEAQILSADEVVKSPGIPDTVEIVKKIVSKGIPVISEIEFAARYTDAKLIAITGSNGKTTTASLTYHILKKAGLNVALAGNIGYSFAWHVAEHNADYYVLEISSFQLDGCYKFTPDIAVITNITPDHLDRYDYDFDKYVASKFRIIQNQNSNHHFVYCDDDEVITNYIQEHKKEIRSTLHPYSVYHKVENGAYINDEKLIVNLNNKPLEIMSIHKIALKGMHNRQNSMAAAIASRVLEIRKDVIRESLSDFQNVEHRLEFVLKVHGIDFINDSKATNVNATWYALGSMTKPVIWIVGGVDKGNDYSMLKELVQEKVKAIVCLGKDNSKIHAAFGDIVDTIVDTQSAQEAVNVAYSLGKKGDAVLLSPACASFDLFENYEDRGHQFKAAVRGL